METTRNKRRGFMKGKLMPFYREAKPNNSSASSVQYINKVMNPSQSSPSAASVGFFVHPDYVISQPAKPKVSFILPEQLESLYGVAVDEAVDLKATSYISSVQERFKLEGIINSERLKCQDIRT